MWNFNYARYLLHHGVKGQKWGVKNGPPYPIKRTKKANWHSYDIYDPSSDDYFHLAEGTHISNKQVFAGKGGKDPLDEETALGLSEQIGGKPENWQHCKGDGIIDYYGEERKADIHWFEEETVGKHKFKVKEWIDD